MELALALALNEATTRVLGVLGFLVFIPLVALVVSRVGKRVLEKRHSDEFAVEVKPGNDDDWMQRTISGG